MGEEHLNELSVTVGAIIAAVMFGFNWLRKAAKGISADVPEFKEHRAHGDFIDRLREEVERLEAIINKMQARIEQLESKVDKSAAKLAQARSEALSLYATSAKHPCPCAEGHRDALHQGLLRIIGLPDD